MSVLETNGYDVDVPDGVRMRFGMRMVEPDVEQGAGSGTLVMQMPTGSTLSPFTDEPSLAALLVLVDTIGSTVGFAVRGARWPVTTELTLQVDPAFRGDGRGPAVVRCSLIGLGPARAQTSYELRIAGERYAQGAVTVAFVAPDGVDNARPVETLGDDREPTLGEMLAVEVVRVGDGAAELRQLPDPMLLNATGHVHGGVAAAGLQLVADAAVNAGVHGRRFRLGSITVNYVRPFVTDQTGCYRARVLRAGSSVAIADAAAIGANGKEAALARVTAYR